MRTRSEYSIFTQAIGCLKLYRIAQFAPSCWIAFSLIFGILAGCKGDNPNRVVVFAASSMSQTLSELEHEFEAIHPTIDLEFVFAGSQALAMQINEGAPVDIFISANLNQMNRIHGFTEPVLLVENELVAIAGHELSATSIRDAVAQAKRIVVAQKDVPIGRYTHQALDGLGIWETTESKIVSYEYSVQGVQAKVILGQADLGFVYRTDAHNTNDSVQPIEFPTEISTRTQTWIALNTRAKELKSSVSIVYQFMMKSPESGRIFTEHRFILPEHHP